MKALGTLITLLFILALAGAGAGYIWSKVPVVARCVRALHL